MVSASGRLSLCDDTASDGLRAHAAAAGVGLAVEGLVEGGDGNAEPFDGTLPDSAEMLARVVRACA